MGLFDRLFRRPGPAEGPVPEEPRPMPEPEGPRDLRLTVANIQGMGNRERQEDSFAVLNAADPDAMAQRGLFAVVCDGMGGMEDGREISQEAVDALVCLFRELDDDGNIPRQFREGVHAVSDALYRRFAGRSGTTAAAVRVYQNALHWFSVGDSGLFLKRGGGVFQLNREQTYLNDLYVRELEQPVIRKERAERDPDAPRLTAFVGMDCLEEVDQSLLPLPLLPGDVILICSDGISGVLTPAEMLEALSLPPGEGCALLETMVLERALPGQDNYTGVVIACQ